MVEIKFPGVYVEEVTTRSHSIEGVSTSTAAFLGSGPRDRDPVLVSSFAEFQQGFGSEVPGLLPLAVRGFFANGGQRCIVTLSSGSDPIAAGLAALARETFSILCCPDEHQFPGAPAKMVASCETRKNAVCILQSSRPPIPEGSHAPAVRSSYAAYYYPWLVVENLAGDSTVTMPPAGVIAGVYARVDSERGVHHAPAGVRLLDVKSISHEIGARESESLSARGINVLRSFPNRGIVVWGGRTISSDPEFKYVNVRRYFIFLEHSVEAGLQWAVFEPNGPNLWADVRETIEGFLFEQWKAGALAGRRGQEAFFVRCDRSTMTQADIDSGRVIANVGVAPVRPAEFVLLRITVQTRTDR